MRRNLTRIQVVEGQLAAPQDHFLVREHQLRGVADDVALELALVGLLGAQNLPEVTRIRVLEWGMLSGRHRGTESLLAPQGLLLGSQAPDQHASQVLHREGGRSTLVLGLCEALLVVQGLEQPGGRGASLTHDMLRMIIHLSL